jgi:hypothetical protein
MQLDDQRGNAPGLLGGDAGEFKGTCDARLALSKSGAAPAL